MAQQRLLFSFLFLLSSFLPVLMIRTKPDHTRVTSDPSAQSYCQISITSTPYNTVTLNRIKAAEM
jgi:hypothetical protein